MIPVDQALLSAESGNCFAACVASVLELPLGAIPDFSGTRNWFRAFERWARACSVVALLIPVPRRAQWALCFAPRTPWIALGPARCGERHAVVYAGNSLSHDPNPHYGRTGISRVEHAIFLVRAVN